MTRLLTYALLAGALLAPALPAQEPAKTPAKDAKPAAAPEHNYSLAYGSGFMNRIAVVELKTADGKPTAKLVAASPNMPGLKVGTPTVKDGVMTLPIDLGGRKLAFEGKADPKNPKRYLGTFGDADLTMRGELEPTELTELTQKDTFVRPPESEASKKIAALRTAENTLRAKARQEDDADEKKKLLDEAAAVATKNVPEIAKLQRQLATAGEGAASAQAAQQLLAGAGKADASEADVKAWLKAIEDEAAAYGPKIVAQARSNAVSILIAQKKYGKLALPYAIEAANAKGITLKAKSAALKLLETAQTQAGLKDDAAMTGKQIAALEAELDKEYLATVPPFKPTPFAGREDKAANRVVVMELFTGAQCPPCVAADVGFDGLIKSYKPADVIFLQYHEHIPGPDPLTNADGVARFSYYGKLNKGDFRGTPSTAFNGKPAASGGGGMGNSEGKYEAYTKVINKALEESTKVAIRGTAKRAGDELTIATESDGLADLPKTAVLRLVLVEENIKYVGGNGLRFHHHVVRSMLGTEKGVALSDLKDGKFESKASLKELRTDLTKYLDGYAENTRPFPYDARPLDLKGLKVVALIQDDKTGEILQATQFDVAE